MKLKVLTMALLLLAVASVSAQQHRAVRLGYPATRFAPPLSQPEQLRALLTDEKLQADVAAILAQAGWKGNVDDLRRAAATAPITEVELPIGTRMPFMSSRKDGKPIARKAKTPPDLSSAIVLEQSKAFNGEVLQAGDSYYVRRPDQDNRIVFTMKRHICQKEIPPGELHNLLENGRTNLIEGFVSKRNLPFNAFLVLSKTRTKADFEFPPR